MSYDIVVYGIGEQYNQNFNILKYFEFSGQFKIVGVTAKWTPISAFLDGYPIISINELAIVKFDFIVIMSSIYFDEIVKDLLDKGIDRKKIISYRVLQIPNLNFDKYIELKDSNLSIISNNCWGGVISHTLAIECRSPFKNLSIEDEDYIKLLKKFRYYLQCDLVFFEYAFNKNSKKDYPVMLLDDLKVHCNHDTDPIEAVKKWNRRRERINYDNLLVEMYTENQEILCEFSKIDEYKRKICFVPFESSIECAYHLSLYPGQNNFWEAVNSNAGNGANSIVYNSLCLLLGIDGQRLS